MDDAAILQAVAAEEPAMLQLLSELVEAPTLLGAEATGQEVMRRAFTGLGLEPFDVPLLREAIEGHPAGAPASWDYEGKPNVVAVWPGSGGGRTLILNGHIDVVSPGPSSLWTSDPFVARRDGEWIYGRAAGDMKAGLAAIVGAVAGLQRLGLTPGADVTLQSVVEEECTGNGALACVLAGHTADAAILTEPTGGAVWSAQVGVLWFQVHILGTPAHAGDAADGANAIDAAYGAIEALRALELELNAVKHPLYAAHSHPLYLNVGMIRGGDWPSSVPGECVLHCRMATFPGSPIADLKARVEATVATIPGAEVRYDGFQCEGYALPADAPLVTALQAACARVTGVGAPVFASTATTDARTFVLYGDTPAVCLGPLSERDHGIDERVHVPSITATAQQLALFIKDWCGLSS
jgi:acetylornithine deacetylase